MKKGLCFVQSLFSLFFPGPSAWKVPVLRTKAPAHDWTEAFVFFIVRQQTQSMPAYFSIILSRVLTATFSFFLK